jgi:sporulation protein YlmC with PRC-barrel domain
MRKIMRRLLYAASAALLMTSAAMAQNAPKDPAEANRNDPAAASTSTQGQGQGSATQANKAQQDTSPGIRSVDQAASVRMMFYAVQPADMRASKLIGTNVYNLANENVGEIEDLIIDNGKTVKAVVVSVGGFLGIGDHNIAVQPGSVILSEKRDGSARVVINTTKEDLKKAPAFNFADVDKAASGAGTTGASSQPAQGADRNTPKK